LSQVSLLYAGWPKSGYIVSKLVWAKKIAMRNNNANLSQFLHINATTCFAHNSIYPNTESDYIEEKVHEAMPKK